MFRNFLRIVLHLSLYILEKVNEQEGPLSGQNSRFRKTLSYGLIFGQSLKKILTNLGKCGFDLSSLL